MKRYTKNWMLAFTLSTLVCACLILALMLYIRPAPAAPRESAEPEREEREPEPFTDVEDNVGAVSFTEDQITELARSEFSQDGFLNDITVTLEENGVTLCGRIKDADALIACYPELEKYSAVISALGGRKITVNGGLVDKDGLAAIEINKVNVAGLPVDKRLLSPFIEEDGFAGFFRVDYDSIRLEDGRLIFYDGLPDVFEN